MRVSDLTVNITPGSLTALASDLRHALDAVRLLHRVWYGLVLHRNADGDEWLEIRPTSGDSVAALHKALLEWREGRGTGSVE